MASVRSRAEAGLAADGTSGIFVSNRVAIPEPTSFALIAMSAAGLLLRRQVHYCPRRI